MPLTKFTGPINTIQSLSDQPNQSDGLTAAQLKMKFDTHAVNTEEYINDVLTPEQDIINAKLLTDNATFDGVKTFTSSPIVPTPTTQMQAATKKYVDDTSAGVVLGQTPDDSLTDAKLKQSGNNILPNFNSHLADKLNHVPYGGTTTNTGNAYVLAYTGITSLAEGVAVSFKCNADSTLATTLNVNGLGAKAIKKANGTDVTNLKNGGIYTVRYSGTNFILQGEGASGNATASDLILGKTATVDAGEIIGTGVNAKRVANGTGTINSTSESYERLIGSVTTGSHYSLVVSGLNFTPSLIKITRKSATTNQNFSTVYDVNGVSNYLKQFNIMMMRTDFDSGGSPNGTVAISNVGSTGYVNGTGFKLPFLGTSGATVDWVAYE